MFKRLLVGFALFFSAPAGANDSMAELKTGGLTFVTTGDVSMEEERLFISPGKITVNYVFKNSSDKDVSGLVAFPMPDIVGRGEGDFALENRSEDNFLDFSVKQDGALISPSLQQRALAAGLDVTDDLVKAGVPLLPFSDAAAAALAKLPKQVIDDWTARGMLLIEAWDEGEGMKDHFTPMWTLRSAYWWRTAFPAGKTVTVDHNYLPSVGGTVGVTFLDENGEGKGARFEEYKARYCVDDDFVKIAQKSSREQSGEKPFLVENWISYILTTGANWEGPIKKFTLTVDKGDTRNFVSFCGEGVEKTGPTTFEMSATDFEPQKDIDILILKPGGQ
jgi:hypothetical protein